MSSEHGLHVMLSYHWDNKELVSKVYKVLKSRNIPVWMDIHGGISFNLFQSMADGVENAAVICCFISPKYQSSRNCEKELLYAERRRVPIIPCRLTRGWEPSAWLGLVLAGLVWIDFREVNESNLDLRIDHLIDQIRIVGEKKLNCFPSIIPHQSSILTNNSDTINALYPCLLTSDSTPSSLKSNMNTESAMVQSSPPPVPPRPDQSIVRERLLNMNVKRNAPELVHDDDGPSLAESEALSTTLDNSVLINSSKPDVCYHSLQEQATDRILPDIATVTTPTGIHQGKKSNTIIIDYGKFRRLPRIIGDDYDSISFCCPSGVAVSKTGTIYVADQQNQCVKMIPLLGNEKTVVSKPFNRPKGIHVDELGRVLLTEQNRLLILDQELNLLKSVGDHGSRSGQFNVPWGVTTDSLLNIYVCDQMNNRIQKFDVDGHFQLEWGYEGEHPGQFYYPHFISIAGNRVAVSDQLNHRIQVFDCFGQYHYKLGEPGNEPGRLSCPFGVCIDANDHIIVADHDNNRVQFFDNYGDVQLILDREANPLFDFHGVHGITLTHDGGLLITDYKRNGKHRLFIFA